MTHLQLPAIPIPEGCEEQAAKLLSGMKGLFRFTADPEAVPDAGLRSFTASFEHALESGSTQALAAAAKRKKPAHQ